MKKLLITLIIITIFMFGGCVAPGPSKSLILTNDYFVDDKIVIDVKNYSLGPKDGGFGHTTQKSLTDILDKTVKKYTSATVIELENDVYILEINKIQYFFKQVEPRDGQSSYKYRMIVSNMILNLGEIESSGQFKSISRKIYLPLYYLKDLTGISTRMEVDKDIALNTGSSKVIDFYKNNPCYSIVDNSDNKITIQNEFEKVPLVLSFSLKDGVTYMKISTPQSN